jgi:N-acetylmuramoyl-L-alanine amidase
MAALNPASVKYIVVHTAAAAGRNVDAREIDRWHKANGWKGIGYHYVILNDRHDRKPDGTLEPGRPITEQGAHVKGMNHMSVGICCVGNGDWEPFTPKQMDTLVELIEQLRGKFGVPVENVIGHRDVNGLVDRGIVPRGNKTGKSCPGAKVKMEEIRARLGRTPLPDIRPRLDIIDPGTPDIIWLPNTGVASEEERMLV